MSRSRHISLHNIEDYATGKSKRGFKGGTKIMVGRKTKEETKKKLSLIMKELCKNRKRDELGCYRSP